MAVNDEKPGATDGPAVAGRLGRRHHRLEVPRSGVLRDSEGGGQRAIGDAGEPAPLGLLVT